ncbi:MAG: hypothetical protein CM15mP80_03250 [Alphaproteobacteria bacterium]|nr:MAG: hypothetical protein CM15mP80_03250 [Alphaproteobacteria bacterium]
MLGLLTDENWFAGEADNSKATFEIERAIEARNQARASRDFDEADRIRDQLAEQGIKLLDGPDGTRWERL